MTESTTPTSPTPPTPPHNQSELNQKHEEFWAQRTKTLDSHLADPMLAKSLSVDINNEAARISRVASEEERLVLLRHSPSVYELVDAEKERGHEPLSKKQSTIAKNPRPKSKPTIRSLTIDAMKPIKSDGLSLKEALRANQGWLGKDIRIRSSEEEGKDLYTIEFHGDLNNLYPSDNLIHETNGIVTIQKSWKTLEDYWTEAGTEILDEPANPGNSS